MPPTKHYRKIYSRSVSARKLFFLAKLSGVGTLFLSLGVLLVFLYYSKDLPRPEKFTENQPIQSTKIYDRTGKVLLYEIYGEEKRTIVPLSAVPDHLKQAVIATEDANFYRHFGIDLAGIIRAIFADLRLGKPAYGGSTIPQQLIRSTFLSTQKTIERKAREIILALELDRHYSKDQILEWYLNQIPFGQNAHGVEAASQTYFNKSVSEISLAEAAVLAALIQAPSRLSPYGDNKDELLARKNYVLSRMAAEGFITKERAEEVKKEEIIFIEKPMSISAPYFTLWVKQQITEKYSEEFLRYAGLKIYTSLDWELQEAAEKATKEGIERNKNYNAYNAGLVAINPKTGEVLALTVGTGDYNAEPLPEGCTPGKDCLFDPKFNVVTGTKASPGRQPGSAFKPFVYVTAFEKGYDDKTTVVDNPTSFGIWGGKEYVPQNYDGKFRGTVSLREGLAQSLNVPSIKTLYLVGAENHIDNLAVNNFTGQENVFSKGLESSVETAKIMGITTLTRPLSSYGPSIVLGGGEVKLIELVSAYGVFATEGLKTEPISILRIEDSQGNIFEENKKTAKRVLEKEPAQIINDILSDNDARAPVFGAKSHMYFENYQVAVKTGTTDDFKDCWIVGYAPSIVAGVWVGNNNNQPMTKKQPAATVAGPVFHDFMEKALLKFPKEEFTPPGTENP